MYAQQDGALIIEGKQGDAVNVQINLDRQGVLGVEGKFPQIGNVVQVLCTIVFIAISFAGYLPYPLLSGVLLGQLISFFWFQPKVTALKKEIDLLLNKMLLFRRVQ